MNFIIKKEQPCSKLQVGPTAPTPTSGYVGGYASTTVSGYSTTRPTTTINPQPTQTTNQTITAQDRGGGAGSNSVGGTTFIGGYSINNTGTVGIGGYSR